MMKLFLRICAALLICLSMQSELEAGFVRAAVAGGFCAASYYCCTQGWRSAGSWFSETTTKVMNRGTDLVTWGLDCSGLSTSRHHTSQHITTFWKNNKTSAYQMGAILFGIIGCVGVLKEVASLFIR